jgi:hypothetical protein
MSLPLHEVGHNLDINEGGKEILHLRPSTRPSSSPDGSKIRLMSGHLRSHNNWKSWVALKCLNHRESQVLEGCEAKILLIYRIGDT